MKIEIDQSGKIEDTHKPTVVAFSNEESGTLIINYSAASRRVSLRASLNSNRLSSLWQVFDREAQTESATGFSAS
jgi:hypothetical protein